jgi:hypothetical protein
MTRRAIRFVKRWKWTILMAVVMPVLLVISLVWAVLLVRAVL